MPEKSFRSPYGDLRVTGTRMSLGDDGLNRSAQHAARPVHLVDRQTIDATA